MKIGKDTIAKLTYTLRYDGPSGDVIEEIGEDNPMEVLIGYEVMLDILEKNLEGLAAGDTFEFIIGEDQGYGAYDDEKLVTVPETELMAAVPEDEEVELQEGDIIPIQDMEGGEFQAIVLKKENGTVTLDFNHPLAGEVLHFRGMVLDVRKATPEEIEAGLEEDEGEE